MRDRLESGVLRSQRKFWRMMSAVVMRRFKAAGGDKSFTDDVDALLPDGIFEPNFNRSMIPHWNVVVWSGVKFEEDLIKPTKKLQAITDADAAIPPSIHVDPSPRLKKRVREYLEDRTEGVWSDVSTTTKKRLAAAIKKGVADGLDFKEMTKRLNVIFKKHAISSGKVLARTEVTASINFGQQAERDDIGIAQKQWISRLDSRNRGANPKSKFDHLAPDGQVQNNSATFTVSGERLLFPGDRSMGASAGNIVYCRCIAASFIDTTVRR